MKVLRPATLPGQPRSPSTRALILDPKIQLNWQSAPVETDTPWTQEVKHMHNQHALLRQRLA
jgi:hypothetical protein